MDLTPADIRSHQFGRAFRGCHPDEVRTFLRQLSIQLQRQLDAQDRLEEKVYDLETKVAHYRQVEEALQEAIRTARESREQTLQHAEREAALIVKEAQAKAAEIEQDARGEHDRLKQETTHIGGRRHEIVARLRAFLMSEMELLAHFEGDDPVGYIKMLPSERQRQLQAAAETPDDDGAARGGGRKARSGGREAEGEERNEDPHSPLSALHSPLPTPPVETEEKAEPSRQALEEEHEPFAEAPPGEHSGPGWTVHPVFSADSTPGEASRRQTTDDGRPS